METQWYTVQQVSEMLSISRYTVARQFESIEGVIDLGNPGRMHKRRKRNLRISRGALDRFIAARQVRRSTR